MKKQIFASVTGAALAFSAIAAETEINAGKNDYEVGANARAMLKEQVEGENRAETEPYRAESAGKAYRAYTDSIGQKTEKLDSQIANKK